MSVLLADAQGDDLVELWIAGYVPAAPGARESFTTNRLSVRIRGVRDRAEWTVEGPFLLTWEVVKLSDWLRAVATGHDTSHSVDFSELHLDVEVTERTSTAVTLRVYFELEARPPWALPDEDFYVELTTSPAAVAGAAASLRDALTSFPPRGVRAAAGPE